jgi:long-chain acyl-CoA synthetase
MKLIGIYSKNRYEWFVSDWACVLFGITSVPLYDTLGVENLTYCLNQTEMTSLFVSSAALKIFLTLKDIGKIKTIISFDILDESTIK